MPERVRTKEPPTLAEIKLRVSVVADFFRKLQNQAPPNDYSSLAEKISPDKAETITQLIFAIEEGFNHVGGYYPKYGEKYPAIALLEGIEGETLFSVEIDGNRNRTFVVEHKTQTSYSVLTYSIGSALPRLFAYKLIAPYDKTELALWNVSGETSLNWEIARSGSINIE